MYWLISRNSKLSIENKVKIYKTIIKPIWTSGISLWGTAAISHINKLEALQSKIHKGGYTQRLKNTNSQRRNRQVRRKIQGKDGNTSKSAAC